MPRRQGCPAPFGKPQLAWAITRVRHRAYRRQWCGGRSLAILACRAPLLPRDFLGYMTHSKLVLVGCQTAVRSIAKEGASMTAAEHTYDIIVLGAGPVGQTAAERTRAAGLSVAMVERELVGGECSYWGCVPSKALLRPVIAVADADHVDGAREAVNGSINATGVFGRRDRYVSNWDDAGQADWVAGIGATLVRGHGRLDGPRRVTVTAAGGEVSALNARHAVVICIGSTAALPDVPGIAEARPWTNRIATDSSAVP